MGPGTRCFNESNCKIMSPQHYFSCQVCNTIASWDLLKIKTLHPRDKLIRKRCRMADKKSLKLVFKTKFRLMQVKSVAECSKGSILQYFGPSLSYHLSLRSLFCLFLSGRFTQVLLYFLIYRMKLYTIYERNSP